MKDFTYCQTGLDALVIVNQSLNLVKLVVLIKNKKIKVIEVMKAIINAKFVLIIGKELLIFHY